MRLGYVVTLLFIFISGCASLNPSPPLTTDPNWSSGTLPNGMRYHLYPVEGEPIELRLVVNVGSLQEKEAERGYAHFIEHMAFNGTRRYPNNTVFDQFAQVGVEFGPDINAFTSYGRTVYVLSLPDRKGIPDAMDWFRDVSDGMTLEDEEVASEIGVIFAEWLYDNREDSSWPKQLTESLIKDSLYSERDPIGTESTLKAVSSASLKAFYDEWYQANRIQLVVIGDFDRENVQAEIEEEFASLRTVSTKPEDYKVLRLDEKTQYPLTLYASQGESPAVVVSFRDGKDRHPKTVEEQHEAWLKLLMLDAVKLRLNEQFERENLSHNGVYFNFGNVPGWRTYELSVEFNDTDRPFVLDAIARNVASLRDYGVTADEFSTLVALYDADISFLEGQSSAEIAQSTVSDLFYNRLPQNRSEKDAIFRQFLKQVSLDDLNNSLAEMLRTSNQSLTLVYGKGESFANAEVQRDKYLKRVAEKGESVQVVYGKVEIPEPDSMATATENPEEVAFNLYRWRMPNGLPALYYRIDEADSQTRLIVQARGGSSALSHKERAAQELLFETYRSGKVGNFDATDFSHHLDSLGINIGYRVLSASHSLSLQLPTDSLQYGLNALRFMMEEVSPNKEVFEREKARLIKQLDPNQLSANDVFTLASFEMIYPRPSYESPLSVEDYQSVTFEDVTALYTKLFGDLGHFSVYIVSDEPVLTVQQQVTAMLGNMDTRRQKTDNRPLSYNRSNGQVIKQLSPENRTYVEQVYIRESALKDIDAVFAEDMLNRVLQNRYNQIVREKHSLSYSPSLSSWTWDGESVMTTTMSALISPEQEKELTSLWPSIKQHLTKPVTQSERDSAARQVLKDLYDSESDPDFWLGEIARYDLWNYDYEGLILPEQVVDRIDREALSELAASIFDDAVFFENILRPSQKNKNAP